MSDDKRKKYIEAKMKRGLGQSPQRRADVEAILATRPITIRCWRCKTYQTGMKHDLRICIQCGTNMWVKDDEPGT